MNPVKYLIIEKIKRIIYLYDSFKDFNKVNKQEYLNKFKISMKTMYRDLSIINEIFYYTIIFEDGFYKRIKI